MKKYVIFRLSGSQKEVSFEESQEMIIDDVKFENNAIILYVSTQE